MNEIGILFIGWVLGILSLIIEPFILGPIKKGLDKRTFKEILKEDIKNKINQMRSFVQSMADLYNKGSLQELKYILSNTDRLPDLDFKIDNDFYKVNYVKILEFYKKTDIINFYERISTMNSIVNIIGNGTIP